MTEIIMKKITIIALLLIIAGLALVLVDSFVYSSNETLFSIGDTAIDYQSRNVIELPKTWGYAALGAGVLLWLFGKKFG